MLSEMDKKMIYELQAGIPICPRPFELIARKLGILEEEVIYKIQQLIETGAMRKFGAILNQRKAGYDANAMVVWEVPDERVPEVGPIMASFPEVTHCYQRPTIPDWPYNMYTMVHSYTREHCNATIQKIAAGTQITKYQILYSITEFKKTAVTYFTNI